jgi:hypothetical protein
MHEAERGKSARVCAQCRGTVVGVRHLLSFGGSAGAPSKPPTRAWFGALCAAGLVISCARGGSGESASLEGGSDLAENGSGGGTADATAETGAGVDAGAWARSACGDRALTYCGQLAQCAPFVAATRYGDDTSCVGSVTAVCLDSVAAPGSGWTDATLRACTHAVGALSCAAFLRGKPAPGACRVTGTTDTGDACVYDGQCRSGYCRVAMAPGQCGNCVTPGLTGSPCGSSADCDGDLMCASSGTCQPPAAAGVACDSPPRPCQPGMTCVGGACTPRAGAGASCDPSESVACDSEQGLFCDEQTSTCQPTGVAQIGQSCGPRLAECYGGGVCDSGTCARAPSTGDACDGDAGCGSLGTCTGGVCQPFTATDCP